MHKCIKWWCKSWCWASYLGQAQAYWAIQAIMRDIITAMGDVAELPIVAMAIVMIVMATAMTIVYTYVYSQ